MNPLLFISIIYLLAFATIHFKDSKRITNLLFSIHQQNKRIIMNQQELADQLTALGTQLEKVKTEILAEVANLETQIQNSGNVTPEVEAALNAVKEKVQGIDDLNTDAPTEPTVEG